MVDEKIPIVQKFKTKNGYYIYDINSNNIVKVDKDIYGIIDSPLWKNNQNILDAKRKGLFSTSHPTTIKTAYTFDRLVYDLDNRIQRLTLFVANDCNLSCKYCIYSNIYRDTRNLTNELMSRDVAKKAVDFYFAHSKESEREGDSIGFYGGEPLLNFSVIKKVIEYVKDKYPQKAKDTIFTISTNLTLLTYEHIKFFIKHNVHLTVSLDGPEKIHNRYRVFKSGKGSYKKVMENLEKFRNYNKEYYNNHIVFNVVLSPPIEFMKVHEFFLKRFPDMEYANIGSLSLTGEPVFEERFGIKTSEGYKTEENIFEIYRKKRKEGKTIDDRFISKYYDKTFWRIHNRKMSKLPEILNETNACMPGKLRLMIDNKGMFYPCEKGDSVSIGDIYNGFDYKKAYELSKGYALMRNDMCKDCWVIRFCTTCYLGAMKHGKLDKRTKMEECERVRKSWYRYIKRYIEIMEENSGAFKDLREWAKKEIYFLL